MLINAACSFKPCLKDLGSKATRALFAVNSRYKLHKLPVHIALELFDSLIVPIILYGCEIWSPYDDHNFLTWDKTDIEKVNTQFLKRLLGRRRSRPGCPVWKTRSDSVGKLQEFS